MIENHVNRLNARAARHEKRERRERSKRRRRSIYEDEQLDLDRTQGTLRSRLDQPLWRDKQKIDGGIAHGDAAQAASTAARAATAEDDIRMMRELMGKT